MTSITKMTIGGCVRAAAVRVVTMSNMEFREFRTRLPLGPGAPALTAVTASAAFAYVAHANVRREAQVEVYRTLLAAIRDRDPVRAERRAADRIPATTSRRKRVRFSKPPPYRPSRVRALKNS